MKKLDNILNGFSKIIIVLALIYLAGTTYRAFPPLGIILGIVAIFVLAFLFTDGNDEFMTDDEVQQALVNNDLEILIEEAKKRGYVAGALIDYGFLNVNPHKLGTGEYKIYNEYCCPILIKWDGSGHFDVLFDFEDGGWVELHKSK